VRMGSLQDTITNADRCFRHCKTHLKIPFFLSTIIGTRTAKAHLTAKAPFRLRPLPSPIALQEERPSSEDRDSTRLTSANYLQESNVNPMKTTLPKKTE
jgi:hypothetical protein